MINLYNFMDGIDGIASSQAISVSLAGLLLYFLNLVGLGEFNPTLVDNFYVGFSFILAASVLGFLVWNWPPAKIFMGDVGSGSLGLLLFFQALWGVYKLNLSMSSFLLLNAVFIADSTYTLIMRALSKQKVWQAHKTHLYQRLDQAGFNRKLIFSGVAGYNLLYLLPLALLLNKQQNWSFLILVLGYAPICLLAIKFKAGQLKA